MEVDGTRYTESQTFTWQKGSTHTLRAVTPQIGTDTYRYTFDHWSDGGAETHTVSLGETSTYTVFYSTAATSVPRVHVTSGPAAGETTLAWDSAFDGTYSIYYSDDLLTWHLADANIPSATGQNTAWIDDGSKTGGSPSLARRRFYRLLANP